LQDGEASSDGTGGEEGGRAPGPRQVPDQQERGQQEVERLQQVAKQVGPIVAAGLGYKGLSEKNAGMGKICKPTSSKKASRK
jgi:hypothetical protein